MGSVHGLATGGNPGRRRYLPDGKLCIYGQQSKFQVPDEGRGVFSAVVIDIDDITGLAKQIFPIYYLENEN